jgi:hypothetical protein
MISTLPTSDNCLKVEGNKHDENNGKRRDRKIKEIKLQKEWQGGK